MTAVEDVQLAMIAFGTIAVGLGVIILAAGDRTRANLGIGSAFAIMGTMFPLTVHIAGNVGDGANLLARGAIILEALAICSTAVYLSGLAATSRSGSAKVRRVNLAVVAIVAIAVIIAVVGLISPGSFFNDVALNLLEPGASSLVGFWIFVPLLLVMTALYMYAYYLLFRERLDSGEHARAVSAFLASPLLVGSQLGTPQMGLVMGVAAMLTTFYGVYRNAVAQGERGAFLSRFLSPQVAEQVRTDGLTTVMRPGDVVLTVVACDLRGFTAYAEGVPSQAVIDLLSDYYMAVGNAVAEVDGTIKDYAGDGILILVGAPLPHPDHAADGLRLAQRVHEVTRPVLQRWATAPHPLGIGVGVATGRVTVGAIGSDARMEYTAVGTPVNLAARLCSAAADGEILIDTATADAADPACLTLRPHLNLKGLSHAADVHAYAVKDLPPVETRGP